MMSSTTNVSGSKAYMVGMNQPSSGAISKFVGPSRSSNLRTNNLTLLVLLGQVTSIIRSYMWLRFNTKLLMFHMVYKQ